MQLVANKAPIFEVTAPSDVRQPTSDDVRKPTPTVRGLAYRCSRGHGALAWPPADPRDWVFMSRTSRRYFFVVYLKAFMRRVEDESLKSLFLPYKYNLLSILLSITLHTHYPTHHPAHLPTCLPTLINLCLSNALQIHLAHKLYNHLVTSLTRFKVTLQTTFEASYQAPFDAYLPTCLMFTFWRARCLPFYILDTYLSICSILSFQTFFSNIF